MPGSNKKHINFRRLCSLDAPRAAAALALALTLGLVGCPRGNELPAEPRATSLRNRLPDIVVLSIDTLRADRLGAWGGPAGLTPELDRFARESTSFARALSSAGSTTPAHLSILTGLTPAVHGVSNVVAGETVARPSLDADVPTFTERLRRAGYLNAGFHDGGQLLPGSGIERGFDTYTDQLIPFRWLAVTAAGEGLGAVPRFLDTARERSRPGFVFLHHYVCHAPYYFTTPAERRRLAATPPPEDLAPPPTPEAVARVVAEIDGWGERERRLGLLLRAADLRARDMWRDVDLARPGHRRHMLGLYDTTVARADTLFGALRRRLEAAGYWDDAVVVVVSDHGEEFYEHGGREHGRLWNEHLHVPLMIKWPRRFAIGPGRVTQPVRTLDLFPTLFDRLGLAVDGPPVQGRSFLPAMERRPGYAPPLMGYNGPGFGWVRLEQPDGRVWLIDVPSDQSTAREFLYARRQDPGEQQDLTARDPALVARLREAAIRIRNEDDLFRSRLGKSGARPPGPGIEPLLEQLRALGYFEDEPRAATVPAPDAGTR